MSYIFLRVSPPFPISIMVLRELRVILIRIPLGEKIDWQYAWLIFALINVVTLIPMFALRRYGHVWRELEWQKPPSFHGDI